MFLDGPVIRHPVLTEPEAILLDRRHAMDIKTNKEIAMKRNVMRLFVRRSVGLGNSAWGNSKLLSLWSLVGTSRYLKAGAMVDGPTKFKTGAE